MLFASHSADVRLVLRVKLLGSFYPLGFCFLDSAGSLATHGYDCPFTIGSLFHDVFFAGRHGGRLAPERILAQFYLRELPAYPLGLRVNTISDYRLVSIKDLDRFCELRLNVR